MLPFTLPQQAFNPGDSVHRHSETHSSEPQLYKNCDHSIGSLAYLMSCHAQKATLYYVLYGWLASRIEKGKEKSRMLSS